MAKRRTTKGTKVSGKQTFSGRTRSGKGTVKGFVSGSANNKKSTVVKRTSYRTKSGRRRVLEIVTTKKVIK